MARRRMRWGAAAWARFECEVEVEVEVEFGEERARSSLRQM